MSNTAQQPQAATNVPETKAEKPKKEFFFKCHITFDKYCLRIANNRPMVAHRAVVICVGAMKVSTTAYHELPLDIYQCWLNSIYLTKEEFTEAYTQMLDLQKHFV